MFFALASETQYIVDIIDKAHMPRTAPLGRVASAGAPWWRAGASERI